MRTAARLGIFFALCLALVTANPEQNVAAFDQGKLVAPGRLVIAGRRLTCGATATLVRDFEGFAVSSTVIMLNIEAMKDLPRPVQWLIYYHECGHIRYGPSETAGATRRRSTTSARCSTSRVTDRCIQTPKSAAISFANASPRKGA
jgi:hypothetical protein